MANLSIKDFPDELLIGGRMEALASGKTFRAWMIDLLEQITGGEQEPQQTTRHKRSTAPSPKRQRATWSDLSDHFKSGQQLSLQNRPTGLAVQD